MKLTRCHPIDETYCFYDAILWARWQEHALEEESYCAQWLYNSIKPNKRMTTAFIGHFVRQFGHTIDGEKPKTFIDAVLSRKWIPDIELTAVADTYVALGSFDGEIDGLLQWESVYDDILRGKGIIGRKLVTEKLSSHVINNLGYEVVYA